MSIQGYLRWLQNAYNYNTNYFNQGWQPAYFYYLWSSSKAYNIIQNTGVAASGTNIDPADMGTLPELPSGTGAIRTANRNPATDTRPPQRGAGAAGFYGGTPKGWYYDYAYRLMSLQNAAGQFPNPNGSWNTQVDHAYAILVLQRSLGGACVDTDGDGVCDSADNCPAVPNPDQKDSDRTASVTCAKPRSPSATWIATAISTRLDIAAITKLRNKPASANPKADADGNGTINVNDARACVLMHARELCHPVSRPWPSIAIIVRNEHVQTQANDRHSGSGGQPGLQHGPATAAPTIGFENIRCLTTGRSMSTWWWETWATRSSPPTTWM